MFYKHKDISVVTLWRGNLKCKIFSNCTCSWFMYIVLDWVPDLFNFEKCIDVPLAFQICKRKKRTIPFANLQTIFMDGINKV